VYTIKEEDIPSVLYINSDQTQVVYVQGSQLTWAKTEAKQISTVGNDEKHAFTIMVSISNDGTLLPLQATYPPHTQFKGPLSGKTLLTSPLYSPKSSPILQKNNYAKAFTHIYHDCPQSFSPPSSLCPSSPPDTYHMVSNIRKYSIQILAASVISSRHCHADISPSMRKWSETHLLK
jgi:hypothetical protein